MKYYTSITRYMIVNYFINLGIITRDAPDIWKVSSILYYPALFYYSIAEYHFIRKYIRLKFDIIKLLIFFLYKYSRYKYAYS